MLNKTLLLVLSVFLVSCGAKVPEANVKNCNNPEEIMEIMDSLPQAKKNEFATACEGYLIPRASTNSCFGEMYERYMAGLKPSAKKEFAAACAKVKPAKAY